jgi:hypothetical protein
MGATPSGNTVHDRNMNIAEGVRQAVLASNPTAIQAKNADIQWARTGLASAKANGVQTGVFVEMLMELGTNGT